MNQMNLILQLLMEEAAEGIDICQLKTAHTEEDMCPMCKKFREIAHISKNSLQY
jgi:hypothetical protein